jgi:hypothetical protein
MSVHKARGYSLNDFLSWDAREELILQPRFQRRAVWSPKAKSNLIDTILRGLPTPIIFIRQQIDPNKRRTVREVVDGQQRLRAVLEFCSPKDPKNGLRLHRAIHPKFGGKTFDELPEEVKEKMLSYEFSVVLLESTKDGEVLDIFARLNSYAQRLTAQELLNAAYYGQFKQAVYSLGHEHLTFWREMGILSDKNIMRMAEAELVSELFVSMLDGIQSKKDSLRKFYAKYDEEFSEKDRLEKEFKAVIDLIAKFFGSKLPDSIFSRRILFYSLFLAVYDLMYGMPGSPVEFNGKAGKISNSLLSGFTDALVELEAEYLSQNRSLADFINATKKATADRKERIIRHKIIYQRLRAKVLAE